MTNPFRGSRAIPKRTTSLAEIPCPEELRVLQAAASGDPIIAAAITVMTEVGLRVGALPGLIVRPDGSFTTVSKGKVVLSFIPFSLSTVKLLNALGCGRQPFSRVTVGAIRLRFVRLVARLYKEGRLAARYSVHDLRHNFAEQNKSRGLYWLARALGRSTVGVTEGYLKNSLGVDPREIKSGLLE